MIRKVAIIAVGGKIGKPFLSRALQLLERELNNHPQRR